MNRFALIICILLLCQGCAQKPGIYVVLLIDRTEAITQPRVEDKFIKTFQALDIDTMSLSWGEIMVKVSSIGQQSTQSYKTLTLSESKSFLSRDENKERQRIRDFLTELRVTIAEFAGPGAEMNKSYINRNLYYHLVPLSRNSGKRLILMWSDLIQNGPRCNFVKLIETPETLTQKRDSFFQIMRSDYQLPDLTGIHLVNYYSPDTANDELYEHVKRYWTMYLEIHGATITFETD